MPTLPQQFFGRLDRMLDWFIPDDLASGREMRQRARMFLISHFFGPFLGNVIPAYLFVLNPKSGSTLAILSASICAFWLYPFLLRWTGQYVLLALLSVQNLVFAILWGCYFYGGVSSPFLPWLLTVPLLAFFYLGAAWKPRTAVMGIITVNLTCFYGYYLTGHPFPEELPLHSMQGIGIVSILSASVYVSMMALYYAKVLASQAELESEVRRHLETAAELRTTMGDAERAGAAKSEFLAKMSHELRTPLNAVIGFCEILLEDAEAEGEAQAIADLHKIHTAGHHLLRLVNDILDLSKIEAGKMEVFNEHVDVAGLIQAAVENCRPAAAQHGTEVTVNLDRALGTAFCDAKKLDQALTHILDNAAKFTRKGRIVISAERRQNGDDSVVTIAVRDTGPGITQDRIPDLFEKFGVAADVSASKYGGAGLGLALSLQLCRLMGGDIAVESARGVGSCFTITLPTMPAEPAPEPEAELRASALPARKPKSSSPGATDAIPAARSRETQTLVPFHA
jgi:signal transduction histidine kinase